MFSVTGPVTQSPSLCRGEATNWTPNRPRSQPTVPSTLVSASHPLQPPALTSLSFRERLNRESIFGGVALNFIIFEGGLRRAEVSEAKARERQAALFYEDLRKEIGIEVQSAYLDLVTQKGILQFSDDQLAFARDNYQAVARQFDFGLSNSLDVLDANTLLVSTETKAVSAVYNYRLALLRMKKATGTLLHNES